MIKCRQTVSVVGHLPQLSIGAEVLTIAAGDERALEEVDIVLVVVGPGVGTGDADEDEDGAWDDDRPCSLGKYSSMESSEKWESFGRFIERLKMFHSLMLM